MKKVKLEIEISTLEAIKYLIEETPMPRKTSTKLLTDIAEGIRANEETDS